MPNRADSDRRGREALRDRLYGHYLSSRAGERAVDLTTEIKRSHTFVGRLVERHVPSDRRITVLDLGCGPGLILHELQQRGYGLLSGVDRSAEQIAAGRAFGIKGLEQGDLFAYLADRAAASLDLVITYDVMEHVDDGE
jgi:2-polyprenyl-3-methyl-5-hydroxy-6-metoxy-1,4-benzoquinol methylase